MQNDTVVTTYEIETPLADIIEPFIPTVDRQGINQSTGKFE